MVFGISMFLKINLLLLHRYLISTWAFDKIPMTLRPTVQTLEMIIPFTNHTLQTGISKRYGLMGH